MDQQWLQQFCRQISLPEVDVAGQKKLNSAHVLVIGLGGLGSTAALLLAGAGVGTLALMDDDQVALSNLHRQIGHTQARIGQTKVSSIAVSIEERFGDTVHMVHYPQSFPNSQEKVSTVHQAVLDADIVLDCTDQFASRHAINRACLRANKVLISAAAVGYQGQLTSFYGPNPASPCYACLYEESLPNEPEHNCLSQGVLGPVPSILGSLQALEACRVLLDFKPTMMGRLLIFDGLSMQFKTLSLPRDHNCPVCQNR